MFLCGEGQGSLRVSCSQGVLDSTPTKSKRKIIAMKVVDFSVGNQVLACSS